MSGTQSRSGSIAHRGSKNRSNQFGFLRLAGLVAIVAGLMDWGTVAANAQNNMKPEPESVGAAAADAAKPNQTNGPAPLTPAARAEASKRYMEQVVAYANAMLEHGRDTYGKVHSPLFATTINLQTMALPAYDDKRAQAVYLGVMRMEPEFAYCANPMQDSDMYQTLYALTELTGDAKYAKASDDAIGYFFKNCQSPATDLMAWGEHIGWELNEDQVMMAVPQYKGADTTVKKLGPHEFWRPWMFWDRTYKLAPDACGKFARGLWDNQINDKQSCDFSRHAGYDKRKTAVGDNYPRHGGFYIETWAEIYQKTKDPVCLEAIESLVAAFDKSRDPVTGMIPFCSKDYQCGQPNSSLSYAISLWQSLDKVPADLAEKMKQSALKTDDIFVKIQKDMHYSSGPDSVPGDGFGKWVEIKDLSIANVRAKYDPYTKVKPEIIKNYAGYGNRWYEYTIDLGAGYGPSTHAATANQIYLRYCQTKRPEYKKMILMTADRYIVFDPEKYIRTINQEKKSAQPFFAQTIAEFIACESNAYRLSGDPKYLDRAVFFAEMARDRFFLENTVLPQSISYSRSKPYLYYAAAGGGDTLMMEFLDLSLLLDGKDRNDLLVWSRR